MSLKATSLLRAGQIPLDNLHARLTLHDALLTLDPLDVGIAGGHLTAVVSLDGRHNPIRASARIGARNIRLARLFPVRKQTKTSIGQINGELELTGAGNSVARMLAKSDGRISLIVANGVVSRLLMEKISLHLLEILQLTMLGDKTVRLHCAVADFDVKAGLMRPNVLILDTDVSSIIGKGVVDLDRETFDLTFVPKTKSTSPVALRTPIHVGGSFSHPAVDLDKGRIAARGVGALALGLLNPLLVLIPLVEMGPGIDSDCGRLLRAAQRH
ncbi:MAG: AsmA family protein [Sterolibacterium sp.]